MIVWKLDELMRTRRIKGRELARRMGIGENYLSRVRHEVPDRLSLELLDGLCRELECTLGDLLEYRPSEVPAPRPRAKAAAREVPVRKAEPAVVEAIAPAAAAPAKPVLVPLTPPVVSVAPALVEPVASAAESAAVEPEEEKPAGAAYVKIGALQARLNRLKQRRD